MRALLGTEFAALLARADVSQATFARLSVAAPGPGSPTPTTPKRAALRNRWSASMPPMSGPAGPDHVAERSQPPCPAPQFGPFTEALT